MVTDEWNNVFLYFTRLGEPHECAGMVSFLASDEALYITGENILITGGIEARLWLVDEKRDTDNLCHDWMTL